MINEICYLMFIRKETQEEGSIEFFAFTLLSTQDCMLSYFLGIKHSVQFSSLKVMCLAVSL